MNFLAVLCNKDLKIFQRLQIALVLRARTILLSWKNLLVLINTILRSESFFYLYEVFIKAEGE